ncbi:polyadenylate-binding protein 2 [Histomonas meleagridis]|uniref:polyadenylate-binding protein 2 n=1 Tax=Histomonas meleagridis TaxID=135588 RepID=UPI0035594B00|nr:polyadenylate-binding protein 2 [Histomonas meleagridis]KAH0805990.1 polyadenylate-binding protein 2 [Histomonas meleagridis]
MSKEIQTIKARIEEISKKIEEEKANEEQDQENSIEPAPDNNNNNNKSDDCSIWVGNVDWSVKKETLEEFFGCCGKIKRCTIPSDHWTHKPKGYAYIEFEEKGAVQNALSFDGHLLSGRNIKVTQKKEIPHVRSVRRRRAFRRQ